MLNQYIDLNKIEFVITDACTGRCRHCSQGEHCTNGESIKAEAAADVVEKICKNYPIKTVMSFGGEPLLFPQTVCHIHSVAMRLGVECRPIITNGFFSKDNKKITNTAELLAENGVNNILLSVDAFHQETIPVEPVKVFALAARENGIPVKLQPAWLVSKDDENPYNIKTREILSAFQKLGFAEAKGNVVFPKGNALKYLAEYTQLSKNVIDPYKEDPRNVRTLSISANGDVLNENIYKKDIMEIINNYMP